MTLLDVAAIFQYGFVIRALVIGIIVSLCAALIGVFLVLKQYALIGHGLGDIAFAATAIALAAGLAPISVSAPVVVIAAFVIMAYSQKQKVHGDIAIGIASTSALSLGIIITAITKGFNVDVYNYMFGSILATNNTDVMIALILGILFISVFGLFYNRLFLITCDEEFARAAGINVTKYQFLLSFLTALIVVVGMKVMGTLLISSLIIFPSVIAKKIAGNFLSLTVISAVFAVVSLLTGLTVSFVFSIPTGASIVLVYLVILLIVTFIKKVVP